MSSATVSKLSIVPSGRRTARPLSRTSRRLPSLRCHSTSRPCTLSAPLNPASARARAAGSAYTCCPKSSASSSSSESYPSIRTSAEFTDRNRPAGVER